MVRHYLLFNHISIYFVCRLYNERVKSSGNIAH